MWEDWKPVNVVGLVFTAGFALLLGVVLVTSSSGWVPLLDGANLMFHEAGHIIYGILGQSVEPWGGTLGQISLPIVAMVVFFFRREPLSLAVVTIWLGENMFNIARYVQDARAQALPLVGGTQHDWAYLLGKMNALDMDHKIANVLRIIGWILMIGAVVWAVFLYLHQRNGDRDLRSGGTFELPRR